MSRESGSSSQILREINKEAIFDLDLEWERQADTLAGLFAEPLKMTQSEYKELFFDFRFPQPDIYKGRFDTLALVQVPVGILLPLSRILEIVGINRRVDVMRIRNWRESAFQTPASPYATWLHNGLPNLGKSVENVRNSMEVDSRGGRIIDGASYFIQDPDVLERHFIDFPGDEIGSFVPYLSKWKEPGINERGVGFSHKRIGSMVAGAEVRTRPFKA